MKKLTIYSIVLLTNLFARSLWAIGLEEVTVENVSFSGESVVIDRGLLENLEEGTHGRFYLQRGQKERPFIFLVAEGELVKSFPKKSYWMLKKIHIPNVINKTNSKILFLPSNKILSGRTLKMRNQHVVMPEKDYNDVDDFLAKNQENVPARLVKESAKYEASPDIYEQNEMKDVTPEADVIVTTYENYKNKSGNYFSEEYGDLTAQKYFVGNTEVILGNVKKAEDKKIFDSVADGYVKKTNQMKYGIKGFYSNQERLKEMPDIAVRGSVPTTFDQEKEDRKQADKISPKAQAKVNRDGEQWSSDMDDAALRKYFIQTGMEKEVRRRELALNELDGHELMLHFSNGLTSHGNSNDPNYQGRGYNLGISYDLHLSRTAAKLKQWSIQFVFEKGVTEYDTKVFNARSEETSYGAYLNYYFINNPLTLNSFIFLAGIGLKSGSASVFSPDFTQEYSYQVLTIPALQLMTKYRFRAGDLTEDTVNMGASLNFGLNLDLKRLSLVDRIEATGDDIYSKISVNDLKYVVGMSVYF